MTESRQTRVFLSYSRKDAHVAERLREAFLVEGFEAFVDTHDILPGEPWQERLSKLINTADGVVFCLSPNFITSEICNWEVAEAERLGKRLLPIVLDDARREGIPSTLQRLNFIFMRGDAEFHAGFVKLVDVLNTDVTWVRDHTRLGERATEWRSANKSDASLLHGDDIEKAELWITKRPRGASEITDDIAGFIAASRKANTSRENQARKRNQVITFASVTVALLVTWLGWLMYGQWQEGLRSQSLFLAKLAHQEIQDEQPLKGLALAIEALPDSGAGTFTQLLRPFVPEAKAAFIAANSGSAWESTLWLARTLEVAAGSDASAHHTQFSQDGSRMLAATETGTVKIWDVSTGDELAHIQHPHSCLKLDPSRVVHFRHCVHSAAFLTSGERLITANTADTSPEQMTGSDPHSGSQVVIWNIATKQIERQLKPEQAFAPGGFQLSGNRERLLASSISKGFVWNIPAGVVMQVMNGDFSAAGISIDGTRVALTDDNDIVLRDVETGRDQRRFKGHTGRITGLTFTANGAWLFSLSEDGTVRRWDLVQNEPSRPIRGHNGNILVLSVSPLGTRFVTGGEDNKLIIWDVLTTEPIAALSLNGKPVHATFSLDGKHIISWVEASQTAEVWAVDGGAKLATLGGHTDVLTSANFSPQGDVVVTAAHDGTVRLWSLLPLQSLIDNARSGERARCLTSEERRELFLDPKPPNWCSGSLNTNENQPGQARSTIKEALIRLLGHLRTPR